MTNIVRLFISENPDTNKGNWQTCRVWNGEKKKWEKPASPKYFYTYTGGKNGKWENGMYSINADKDSTVRINRDRPNDLVIRELILCEAPKDKDPATADPPDYSPCLPLDGFNAYPIPHTGSGDWNVVDKGNPGKSLHIWICAQMTPDDPPVMCDPMVHNDGGSNK